MANSKFRCLHCRDYFAAESVVRLPAGSFCSLQHAVDYGRAKGQKALESRKRAQSREAKAQQREASKAKREAKQGNYSHQFNLTKKMAQKLANRLDANLPCICCDEPRGKAQFCGGHAKSAGAHPELALDLRNIHGQRNALCNQHKSGNWAGDKHSKGYRQGLIDRYGQSMLDWLESYHPPAKRTVDELMQLRAVYAEEIRRLERGESASRDWRQIVTNCYPNSFTS